MRNFYQQSRHPNNIPTDLHSFNNNEANFQFNTSPSTSSILSYIDTASTSKKHQPILTSPNRPPPLPTKPNRLAKKLLSLSNSNNSSILSPSSTSNSVYLDLPNTSLDYKSSCGFESNTGVCGDVMTGSTSTSSSPSEEDYHSYSSGISGISKMGFNSTKMFQQFRVKTNTGSSSDLLVFIKKNIFF